MAAEYGEEYPYRDEDSLKRKYNQLHRVEIPTGDPDMSKEVRLVKKVKYLIGERAVLGDDDKECDLYSQSFTNVAAADSLQELRGEFALHDMSTVAEEEDGVELGQQDELTTTNTTDNQHPHPVNENPNTISQLITTNSTSTSNNNNTNVQPPINNTM